MSRPPQNRTCTFQRIRLKQALRASQVSRVMWPVRRRQHGDPATRTSSWRPPPGSRQSNRERSGSACATRPRHWTRACHSCHTLMGTVRATTCSASVPPMTWWSTEGVTQCRTRTQCTATETAGTDTGPACDGLSWTRAAKTVQDASPITVPEGASAMTIHVAAHTVCKQLHHVRFGHAVYSACAGLVGSSRAPTLGTSLRRRQATGTERQAALCDTRAAGDKR